VVLYVSAGLEIKKASMPDLLNATQENAEKTLENQDLHLVVKIEEVFDSVVAKGRVVKTEPGVGSKIKTGDEVTLYISKGPEMKAMPNLVDMNISDAYKMLDTAGFVKTPVIEYAFSDTVEKDRVMEQSEPANTEIDVNTVIKLIVSKGPEETEVPTDPTDPTDPADPTDPTDPEETKSATVTFSLPEGREETYNVQVLCNGTQVYSNGAMATDQTSLTVTVTGTGTATCTLVIDGTTYDTKTVTFE
jgi:beta-lactam-binding protein with PASTA domain